MIKVYFVRHAQPEHEWEDDRTRPLTAEGKQDEKLVIQLFMDKDVESFYCSPYKRSMDTISESAEYFKKEIITDESLREREKGPDGNNQGMCMKQKCYRARLTPKAVRLGMVHYHLTFPYDEVEKYTVENWVKEYENKSNRYGTCQLIQVIGNDQMHEVVRLHDKMTRALENGLELK